MDMIKKDQTQLSTNVNRLGFEEPTDQTDLIIPAAKLFQGTPTEQEQYPNAKMGQIVNSLTHDVLPSQFIPVFKWTEVVKFNKRNEQDEGFDSAYEPGALIWKATSPADPRWVESEWGKDGEKPTADKIMSFLCYFVGVDMPLILRFSRTSYKAGKKLLSLAQFSGGNMFDRRYKLGVKKEQSDKNIYHVFTVEPDGLSTADEIKKCKNWYEDLRGKALKAHEVEFAE
jgi:hypothetical protein